MNPIVLLAIQEAPAIIEAFKALFAKQNPGAPVPTDADVIVAFDLAVKTTLQVDEAWKQAHPVSATV